MRDNGYKVDLARNLVVSTVSRGRIRSIDTTDVPAMPGVLGVIDHRTAPRPDPEAGMFFGPDAGLLISQDDVVPHAGRPVALVVAETLEQARAVAEAPPVTSVEEPHDTAFSAEHPADACGPSTTNRRTRCRRSRSTWRTAPS